MFCAQCCEKILSDPVKQGNDYFCSLTCANLAAGYDPEEENNYYEEDDNLIEDLFSEESVSLEEGASLGYDE
ncbi:MAG: hypothetical protein GXO93_00645 [FCB group bacterium]|nr:hypothetical protein [FCB group bacterium]